MFRVLRRYSLVNAYSGQKLFCEMGNQSFNVFYTGFPLILLGVLDRDVLASTVEAFPQASVVCAVFPRLGQWGFASSSSQRAAGVSNGVPCSSTRPACAATRTSTARSSGRGSRRGSPR